jgi:IMP dehydrogenase
MIGFLAHRDVRYQQDMSIQLKEIMTPKIDEHGNEKLITANRRDTLDINDVRAANKVIRQFGLDTLPIVDDHFHVVALVTDSDIHKDVRYPLATKDDNKQLKTFIAVESRLEAAQERIGRGNDVGINGIVIDSSVVFKEQLEISKYCKRNFPNIDVVLGNVDSAEMVRSIITEASDYCSALRVGIGPGYACKTQQELGVGRAQASAVWDCAEEAKRLEGDYGLIPIIADGGIRILDIVNPDVANPGDITKALALGAQTIMMGGLLAGLDESPGDKEFDYETDRMVKRYRGMGSLEAMERRAGFRYGYDPKRESIKIAEGVVTKVPYRGSGYDFIPQLVAGVKQSMQKQGFRNVLELQAYADIRSISRKNMTREFGKR